MMSITANPAVISRVGSEAPKSPSSHDASSSMAGDLSTLRQQYRVHLSPYRHVPPLEMTIAADSFTVISQRMKMTQCHLASLSLRAEQSGVEKSPSSNDAPVFQHRSRNLFINSFLSDMTPLYSKRTGNFSHTVSYPACHLCFSHLFTSPLVHQLTHFP